MKLNDIIYTEQDILGTGYTIENNIIEGCSIRVIGHFGNLVSFDVYCKNVCIYSGYNNTENLGIIIKAFIEMFGLESDSGYDLKDFHDIPCRVIFEHGNKAVGFGHFMNDKFVLSEDFAKLSE